MLAVKKLHEATGHRDNKRLARALVLAGAPAEIVSAAKAHKCDLCAEQRPPKSRRPATLPTPRDTGDQVHLDLVEVFDVHQIKYYVVHVVDWATRFQMARLLPNRSSEEVICFLREMWWPIFGPPRVLVADQARELISHDFEAFCSENGVLLWHTAVQAPWQNGFCERGGGILKCLIATVVKKHSVGTFSEMAAAVHEATTAYNHDVNEAGVSPAQAALGKQPRMVGDVLGGFHARLSEHGLIDAVPHLARRLALRETAKVAMTRLHFSRAIRRAEVARSRTSTLTSSAPLEPGSIVYFWRESKYNPKGSVSKRKLLLKRWHGPALLVAKEGHANAFVSFKGQLTKCALEHVRMASTMEQISADTWRDAIEESVEAALRDITARGLEMHDSPQMDSPALQAPPAPPAIAEAAPVPLPLSSRELVAALQPGPTPAPSGRSGESVSRSASLLSSNDDVPAPQGEATASASAFHSKGS